MNKSALRYKLYKHSIEKNFTPAQRDLVLSESFLSKVGAFLGLGGQVGGALANAFKNSEVQSITKSMKKDFQDLKNIASKIEDGDKVVIGLLKSLLTDAGFNADEVSKADLSKLGAKQSGSSSSPSGPITTAAIDKNPTVAANLVAAVTDKKPEEVAAAMEKKKPNGAAVSKVIGTALSDKLGIDVNKATMIVKAAMDTGHLVHEGNKYVHRSPVDLTIERWQTLAGIDLMQELSKKKANKQKMMAQKKAAKQAPPSKTPPQSGNPVTSTSTPATAEVPTQKETPKPTGSPASTEKQKEKPEEKKDDQKTETMKKKFEKPFKDVRGKVKETDVSDEEILNVLNVIIPLMNEKG